MSYDRVQFQQKLERWRSYMVDFRLPTWESLPDMELYMDQVISLVNRYLNLIPQDDTNPVITASAVNNYVRLRMMPAPERKRYRRHHMACVIMICILKQSLTLAEIQRILPVEMTEENIRQTYHAFVGKMASTTDLFIDQVAEVADQVLTPENDHGCDSLILHSAVSSVLYKLLTAKLSALQTLPSAELESIITQPLSRLRFFFTPGRPDCPGDGVSGCGGDYGSGDGSAYFA